MSGAKTLELKILLCDPEPVSARRLAAAIERVAPSCELSEAETLAVAKKKLFENSFNTIIVDPVALGLEQAARWIFEIRHRRPQIVFVLYVDLAKVEARRGEFFRGERSRFSHYYKLDKKAVDRTFDREVEALLEICEEYVAWATVAHETQDQDRGEVPRHWLIDQLPVLSIRGRRNTVFLACSFAERYEQLVEGLEELLEEHGFVVIKGDSVSGSISKAILDAIRESEYVLCLMTRDLELADGTFVSSPWVLEEKGAAIAFEKRLVLMAEKGVSRFGGLDGDYQRIPFTESGFLKAALRAVRQLEAYAGRAGKRGKRGG